MLPFFFAACAFHAPAEPPALVAAEGPVQTVLRPDPAGRVHVGLRAGSAHDPPGREGLAWVTAQAVATGVGADVDIGPEIVLFRVAHADAGRLAAALVSPPSPELVAGARVAALAALDRLDCRQIAERAWDAWIYAGHPYGHAPEGRRSVVPTLTDAEVAAFQAVRYVRSAAVVGLPVGVVRPSGFDVLPARLSASPVPTLRLPTPSARTLIVVAEGHRCLVAGAPALAGGGAVGGGVQRPAGVVEARREGRWLDYRALLAEEPAASAVAGVLERSGSSVNPVVPVASAPAAPDDDAIFAALLQRDPWPSRASSPRPIASSAPPVAAIPGEPLPVQDSVRRVLVLPLAEAAAWQESPSDVAPSLPVEELLR